MKMKLYEALIEAVPADLTVTDAVAGETWTAVRSSSGAVGLAMTTPAFGRPALGGELRGMPLRDAAALVRSWNLQDVAFGMASLNAWFNSPAHLAETAARQEPEFCTTGLPIAGKRICLVGDLRFPEGTMDGAASVSVLERRTDVPGAYPDSACEDLIPESDLVIITGSAFVNKTMPRLLELASGGDVIICGPTAPLAEELFSFGANRISGLQIEQPEPCMEFAASGGFRPPYAYGAQYMLSID